jgi:hypothetical protein
MPDQPSGGKTMRRTRRGRLWIIAVLTGVVLCVASSVLGAPPEPTYPLLTIGSVKPDAINLKVWTNVTPGKTFKPGDQVVIYFRADHDCYVTIINVAVQGDVQVLFPNKERPDNHLQAEKEYSLFGPGSRLQLVLGKGAPEKKIVFFVSPDPISFDPLKMPQDQAIISLSASAKNELKILNDKIEQLSKKKGFNRVVLAIKSNGNEVPDLRLMGGPVDKRVPGRDSSDIPEGISGTPGRTETPEGISGTPGRSGK